MLEALSKYKAELESELSDILRYWMEKTPDDSGGFIGRITQGEQKDFSAPKGAVLNSRILWSFSAAYTLTRKNEYLQMAKRSFNYLQTYFIDREFGGVFWTVSADGVPLDTKKQVYALSFAVYGFSEYFKASGDEEARKAAVSVYERIVKHTYDPIHGGYFEALTRDWRDMDDIRLSDKDANERKSMNTHLHVLEGFANLYQIWPDDGLKERLVELVKIFLTKISSGETKDLILFFEDDWKPKSGIISYGHNIEAAWLVEEAAQVLDDSLLLSEVKNYSLELASAAARGLDLDGGIWYEYDVEMKELTMQKHWWPQAEAMVGFFHAWEITGDEIWLQRSLNSWQFVQRFIKDKNSGEWHWGIDEDHSLMAGQDKVGIWKCPYHNSRACIEIVRRLSGAVSCEIGCEL